MVEPFFCEIARADLFIETIGNMYPICNEILYKTYAVSDPEMLRNTYNQIKQLKNARPKSIIVLNIILWATTLLLVIVMTLEFYYLKENFVKFQEEIEITNKRIDDILVKNESYQLSNENITYVEFFGNENEPDEGI